MYTCTCTPRLLLEELPPLISRLSEEPYIAGLGVESGLLVNLHISTEFMGSMNPPTPQNWPPTISPPRKLVEGTGFALGLLGAQRLFFSNGNCLESV